MASVWVVYGWVCWAQAEGRQFPSPAGATPNCFGPAATSCVPLPNTQHPPCKRWCGWPRTSTSSAGAAWRRRWPPAGTPPGCRQSGGGTAGKAVGSWRTDCRRLSHGQDALRGGEQGLTQGRVRSAPGLIDRNVQTAPSTTTSLRRWRHAPAGCISPAKCAPWPGRPQRRGGSGGASRAQPGGSRRSCCWRRWPQRGWQPRGEPPASVWQGGWAQGKGGAQDRPTPKPPLKYLCDWGHRLLALHEAERPVVVRVAEAWMVMDMVAAAMAPNTSVGPGAEVTASVEGDRGQCARPLSPSQVSATGQRRFGGSHSSRPKRSAP